MSNGNQDVHLIRLSPSQKLPEPETAHIAGGFLISSPKTTGHAVSLIPPGQVLPQLSVLALIPAGETFVDIEPIVPPDVE